MQNSKLSFNQRIIFGFGAKILALFCFCFMSLGFANSAKHNLFDSLVQFSLICVVGTSIMAPLIFFFYRQEFKNSNFKLYPLRALLSIIGMITWMEAVKHFGSNQAILVNYLTPIITLFLVSFSRDEKLKLNFLFFGICCYLIIYFTLKSSIAVASYGFLMAFSSSVCWAFYEMICKKQTLTENYLVQVFNTFLFAAIFLLPFSFLSKQEIDINFLLDLSIMSVLRIINVILLFIAIKFASINWLTPVSFLKLPIMALCGFITIGAIPPVNQVIAATLLIIINLLAIKSNNQFVLKSRA